jgi:two-component system OmpR family sensor kinase
VKRFPRSLHRRLLVLLLIAVGIAAALQAALAYRIGLAEADQLFDNQMQQIAMSLRGGFPAALQAPIPGIVGGDADFDLVIRIWSPNGLTVFESPPGSALPQPAVLGFSDVPARSTTYRVYSIQTPTRTIQVAQDIATRRKLARSLALRFVLPIALLAPLLMAALWLAVGSSLAPLQRTRMQVAERAADDLSPLSEADLPDEVRPLVSELNLLFRRVDAAFKAREDFVADAAHELRSPLAALKLQIHALQRASNDEVRRLAIQRLGAGIDRAARMVEQLLVLARQDAAAQAGGAPESLVLAHLVQRVVADGASLAEERRIDLAFLHSDESAINGHSEPLSTLVRNLLDNALKYTPEGGKVRVAVRRRGEHVALVVDDSGPGIADEDRERVFDRFYRVAGSQTPGSGLGLAIVKAIADRHGARLSLADASELGGLRVSVEFPEAV